VWGGIAKCLQGFGAVTYLEKDHLEELRIDERILIIKANEIHYLSSLF